MKDKAARRALHEQKRHNKQIERVMKGASRDRAALDRAAAREQRRRADAAAFRASGQHLRDDPPEGADDGASAGGTFEVSGFGKTTGPIPYDASGPWPPADRKVGAADDPPAGP